jgi:hypothetical protein
MSEFIFEFKGFNEVQKILNEMSTASKRGVFKKAFNLSIARFLAELQRTTAWKDRSGELRSTMDIKSRTRKGNIVRGVEGPYYGRFLEFGWIPGKRPGSRSLRAKRAAAALNFIERDPWIAPVFERMKEQEIHSIITDMEKEVLRIWNRHAKKTARGK